MFSVSRIIAYFVFIVLTRFEEMEKLVERALTDCKLVRYCNIDVCFTKSARFLFENERGFSHFKDSCIRIRGCKFRRKKSRYPLGRTSGTVTVKVENCCHGISY